MAKTVWHSTRFPGVRFREHPTRKHGLRPDRYFQIRYSHEGKRYEQALGWSSQGWTEARANATLSELFMAAKTGEGERTLAEKREKAEAKRKAEEAVKAERERAALTFGDFWERIYLPQSAEDKSSKAWSREEQLARLWIIPVIGNKSLVKISPLDLERIKKNMADAGRAPRSVQYCLATIRQAFNVAHRLDLFSGDNPVGKVKKPKLDNQRLRFLTEDEAQRLLEAIRQLSQQVHDMALLSLHCGLRAGEIFNLTWRDVDIEKAILTLRDTKSGKTRYAHATTDVVTMLAGLGIGDPEQLVFPGRGGVKIKQISDSFERAVAKCGLNNGVTDRRDRVVFHTLRHSFASWLVQAGVDLFTVKEMLGHSTLAMTERYSHLAPDAMRHAVNVLNGMAQAKEAAPARVVNLKR